MVRKLYVPDEYLHPSWTGEQPDRIKPGGLAFATLPTEWIVQMQFQRGSDTGVGNGFFVNIPGVPDYHVILTAGHNLVGLDGALSQNITVKALQPVDDYVVPDGDTYICKSYKAKRDDNDANDWAVVLYPRGKPNLLPPRFRDQNTTQAEKDAIENSFGFRISLHIGHAEKLQGQATVSGYRDQSKRGEPVSSSGDIMSAYEMQVEYKLKTERGISGSCVWIAHRTFPTVIAIQCVSTSSALLPLTLRAATTAQRRSTTAAAARASRSTSCGRCTASRRAPRSG